MGRLTGEIVKSGLIRELYTGALSTCTSEQVNNFTNLTNNADRYAFVSRIADASQFQLERVQQQAKSHKMAFLIKQNGNQAFQKKNWRKAAEYYTGSLLLLPSDDGNR